MKKVFTPCVEVFNYAAPSGIFGAVAQLIERFVRNEEVRGLIPLSSTKFP